MKLTTMKAWVERNNFVPEFIEAGGMDGEYFYLTPSVGDTISKFVDKSVWVNKEELLQYVSIKDLKLPYDNFTIERTRQREELDKDVVSLRDRMHAESIAYQIKRQTYPFDYLEVMICHKMIHWERGTHVFTKGFVFIIGDIETAEDHNFFWLGDKHWNFARIDVVEAGEIEGFEPVFGVAVRSWDEKNSHFVGPNSLDFENDDFWHEEMIESQFTNGASDAIQGIIMAQALNFVKTGIKHTKSQCSIVPTKRQAKKKISGSKKHFFTTISLDAVETIKENRLIKREGVNAHTVRGHFKQRKNGLFWWNPFVRGSGQVKERDAYAVKE